MLAEAHFIMFYLMKNSVLLNLKASPEPAANAGDQC